MMIAHKRLLVNRIPLKSLFVLAKPSYYDIIRETPTKITYVRKGKLMWCPVCRNEYREGITECADCKVALVADLNDCKEANSELLVLMESEEDAKKLVSYLEYSDIVAYYEPSTEDAAFSVYVNKKDYKKAKKAFSAFLTVELSDKISKQTVLAAAGDASADDSDGDTSDDMPENETDETQTNEDETSDKKEIRVAIASAAKGSYVSKDEKSADYRSSAITFTVFGIIGCVVMALHWLGIFQYFATTSAVVLSLMFVGCIAIGIDSFRRAKKAQAEAREENAFVEQLTDWLDRNLTFDMLTQADRGECSDEVNFLNRIAEMKKYIQKEFGELDPGFLDQFTEEYYNDHFEEEV